MKHKVFCPHRSCGGYQRITSHTKPGKIIWCEKCENPFVVPRDVRRKAMATGVKLAPNRLRRFLQMLT